jgi:hypothetical protein
MSLKFELTPRNPMMDFWEKDFTLGGTKNQRDNDHDDVQAERHCREIDNKLSHKNLITPNFVIDEDLEIDFGGTITLRLIDLDRGLWLTSDGLHRNVKIFLLGLTLRDECDDKSIFDKYMFRKGTTEIRLKFMDEVGVFVSKAYQQTNDIIEQILVRNLSLKQSLKYFIDGELYNQNYFVLKQLGAYSEWVKNHNFKLDNERLTAFENILNLYRVVFTRSINDVDSFMNNSDEVGVPTNGISSVANNVLTHIQNKYCSKSNQNDFVNETINEQIKFIFSPLRMRVPPTKANLIESANWIINSYYRTTGGYSDGDARDNAIGTVCNEINNLLDVEIETYGDRDSMINPTTYIDSDNKSIRIHLKTALRNWNWHKDLNSINRYFDDDIVRSDGKRWIPLLLKYEREKRRELTVEEIRTIQMFHIFGKFVKYGKKFDKLLGHALYDVDSGSDLMDILVGRFVNNSTSIDQKTKMDTGKLIIDIDFHNQLVDNYILSKGKDKDSDNNNKYFKYIDMLLAKMMIKGNKKNWANIDPYEVGDNQMEHWLARLYKVLTNETRSDMRFCGTNFFNLPAHLNGYVSNDNINKKIKAVKGTHTTIGQLFAPNGQLEKEVGDLLNSSEYDVFRQDKFDNQEWIDITSVGILDEKSNLPNNLIHKYRSNQVKVMMRKIFNV